MGGIDVSVGRLRAAESHLYGVVAFGGDVECGDVLGHADGVFTLFVGHCGVALVAESLHAYAGEGLSGTGIVDGSADFLHDVLWKVGLLGGLCRRCGLCLVGSHVVLGKSLSGAEEHKEADTGTQCGLLYHEVAVICLHSI